MPSPLARTGLALVCLSFLHGCQSTTTPGASCARPSDCAAPFVCSFGRCRVECRSTRDCALGTECLLSAVGVGSCALPQDTCEAITLPCTAGLVCAGTTCRQGCVALACAEGSACMQVGTLDVCVATSTDASVTADAMASDAGSDAAARCTTPPAPALLGPKNGALTGSALGVSRGTLRPTFAWLAPSCAVTYDIEVDDSCTTPGFASCDFPSPELSATQLMTTSTRPSMDLPISTVVPLGRRYYWRVRACAVATCGVWSEVRYLDVGRIANDVNGDGYSDLVVGARYVDSTAMDEGAAYVYFGGAGGIATTPSRSLESPHHQHDARFGNSVAFVGDLDADGYADLVVGSYAEDVSATDDGAAYVYLGSSSGVRASPTRSLASPSHVMGANFGVQVAGAGDVDGDGYADLIVGAYQDGTTAEGDAYVYAGGVGGVASMPTTTLANPEHQAAGNFGASVASAGDVNGDGYDDVVIGAYYQDGSATDEGAAYLYLGRASGLDTMPSLTLANPTHQSGGLFGTSVASARDVNGDGYDDVVIGAAYQSQGAGSEGNAFVYLGGPSGLASTPSTAIDNPTNQPAGLFGFSVASAGDVNGDGLDDLVIGAYQQNAMQQGSVFVFFGGTAGIGASPSVTVPSPNGQARAWFGGAVAGAGDLNGDGWDDVVIGAEQESSGAMHEGGAFVHHGSAEGTSVAPTLTLDSPANQVGCDFGYSVF